MMAKASSTLHHLPAGLARFPPSFAPMAGSEICRTPIAASKRLLQSAFPLVNASDCDTPSRLASGYCKCVLPGQSGCGSSLVLMIDQRRKLVAAEHLLDVAYWRKP
jgi:hypothetical protein